MRTVYTFSNDSYATWTAVSQVPMGWVICKYIYHQTNVAFDMMMVADDQHITSPESFRGPGEALYNDNTEIPK